MRSSRPRDENNVCLKVCFNLTWKLSRLGEKKLRISKNCKPSRRRNHTKTALMHPSRMSNESKVVHKRAGKSAKRSAVQRFCFASSPMISHVSPPRDFVSQHLTCSLLLLDNVLNRSPSVSGSCQSLGGFLRSLLGARVPTAELPESAIRILSHQAFRSQLGSTR